MSCPSRREQVIHGIWAGKGMKEIAAELGVSPKTVEYHRAQLYRVFGVRDLVSLCRRAMALGLIKPDVLLVRRPVRASGRRRRRSTEMVEG